MNGELDFDGLIARACADEWTGVEREVHPDRRDLVGASDDGRAAELLVCLLDCGAAALFEEDKRLRASFREGCPDKIARGLAYWVFEHVLVYILFRAWVGHANVTWDEIVRSSDPDEAEPRRRADLRTRPDLVVDGDGAGLPFYFEAKWWKVGTPKSAGIEKDVRKLRGCAERRRKSGHPVGNDFVLAFWWGVPEELRKDLEDATIEECEMIYAAVFPTEVMANWGGHNGRRRRGYFCMAAYRVPPRRR